MAFSSSIINRNKYRINTTKCNQLTNLNYKHAKSAYCYIVFLLTDYYSTSYLVSAVIFRDTWHKHANKLQSPYGFLGYTNKGYCNMYVVFLAI